jgi:hypothetical protein
VIPPAGSDRNISCRLAAPATQMGEEPVHARPLGTPIPTTSSARLVKSPTRPQRPRQPDRGGEAQGPQWQPPATRLRLDRAGDRVGDSRAPDRCPAGPAHIAPAMPSACPPPGRPRAEQRACRRIRLGGTGGRRPSGRSPGVPLSRPESPRVGIGRRDSQEGGAGSGRGDPSSSQGPKRSAATTYWPWPTGDRAIRPPGSPAPTRRGA